MDPISNVQSTKAQRIRPALHFTISSIKTSHLRRLHYRQSAHTMNYKATLHMACEPDVIEIQMALRGKSQATLHFHF